MGGGGGGGKKFPRGAASPLNETLPVYTYIHHQQHIPVYTYIHLQKHIPVYKYIHLQQQAVECGMSGQQSSHEV